MNPATPSLPWFVYRKLGETSYSFPDHPLVKNIHVDHDRVVVDGYYVGLSDDAAFDRALEMVVAKNWEFFSSVSAQFLLFVLFKATGEFFVLTDLYGTFPLYFSTVGDQLLFSPSPSWIAQQRKTVTIDIQTLLQMVAREHVVTDATLFRDVKRLFPGCVMKVEPGPTYTIKSYLGLFTQFPELDLYDDFERFYDDFLATAESVLASYLLVVGDRKFAVDLTAGVDGSFLAFLSKKLAPNSVLATTFGYPPPRCSENLELIERFVQTHQLPHHFVDIGDAKELFTRSFFEWMDYPGEMDASRLGRYLSEIQKLGAVANIAGHGGDELYGSKAISAKHTHLPYLHYYQLVHKLKLGIDLVLSEAGITRLLDRSSYSALEIAPTFQASSVTEVNVEYFFPKWRTGVWVFLPLADVQLVRLCQRMPVLNDSGTVSNREFWAKVGPRIHLPEQLTPNVNPNLLFNEQERMREKRDRVAEMASTSVFQRLNLFRLNQIAHDFSAGSIDPYIQNEDRMSYLVNLLKISEYVKQLQSTAKVHVE